MAACCVVNSTETRADGVGVQCESDLSRTVADSHLIIQSPISTAPPSLCRQLAAVIASLHVV